MKLFFIGLGYSLINLWSQLKDHPAIIGLLTLLSALLSYVLESAAIVGILFLLMFVMVLIDTWTGAVRAKRNGTFDYKILKEKAMYKVMGYIIFLIAFGFITLMMFVFTFNDGKSLISSYYLNIPLTTVEMFFAGVEFLSIKDNLQDGYGIKTPASITKRVENLVGDIDTKGSIDKKEES